MWCRTHVCTVKYLKLYCFPQVGTGLLVGKTLLLGLGGKCKFTHLIKSLKVSSFSISHRFPHLLTHWATDFLKSSRIENMSTVLYCTVLSCELLCFYKCCIAVHDLCSIVYCCFRFVLNILLLLTLYIQYCIAVHALYSILYRCAVNALCSILYFCSRFVINIDQLLTRCTKYCTAVNALCLILYCCKHFVLNIVLLVHANCCTAI